MVCLDTTFLIDVINRRVKLENLKSRFNNENVFIPSPVIVELSRGLHLKSNLKNIRSGEKEKIESILSLFNTLDFGKEEAMLAGKIEAELNNAGELIDFTDILIGAICLINSETLITKNKKHFEKISGLKTESY